jgi:acetate kinase
MVTHRADDEERHILVFNVGSSSLTFKLYRHSEVLLRGKCHRVGVKSAEPAFMEVRHRETEARLPFAAPDHVTAATHVLDYLDAGGFEVDAVGHRFADGGGYFDRRTVVDGATRPLLERCAPLAPLHNVAALATVDLVAQRLPGAFQYVVFDSTFHAGLPDVASTYALPRRLAETYRKHGFHGLSYADVVEKATWYLGEAHFRAVVLHLGTGGSSACAIVDCHSVDTSMGYSPLQGLVMNTRCGDLDPGIVVELMRQGHSADDLSRLLHRESGLYGLSGGLSSDIRDLIAAATDPRALAAVDLYVYRIKQYIGAYSAVMNGLDLLIFTDDVGLRVPQVRSAVCLNMDYLGIRLDEERNRSAVSDRIEPLHADDSRVRILAIPNDEERSIYDEGLRLLGESLPRQ